MENIEEIIKNKLSQSTSLDGIDSDLLWNNIVESTNAPRKKKKGFLFLFIILLSAIVGSILFMYFTYFNKSLLSNMNKDSISFHNTAEPSFNPLHVKQYKKVQSTQNISQLNSEMSTATQPSNASKPLYSKKNDGNTIIPTYNKLIPLDTVISQNVDYNRLDTKTDFSMPAYQVEKADSNSTIKRIPNLYALDFSLSNTADLSNLALFPSIANDSKKIRNRVGMSYYSGIVIIQNRFLNQTNTLADTLNKFIRRDIGFNLGTTFNYYSGKNWFFKSGFEYSNWRDRFDALIITDSTIQINQQDVIARNFRTIRHTNSASMLTIPLQFGIFKEYNNFRIAMQIGASYTFVTVQEGRMLSGFASVFDYSQTEKRYHNFFSLKISPYISYKLNDKIMIDVLCNFGLQNHKQTVFNELRSRSLSVMPSIGFTYNY